MASCLRFEYVNWHGNLHVYIVQPESITVDDDHPQESHRGQWLLHAQVVSRDGDKRTEQMGDNRRRSFIMARLRSLSQVEA